MGANKRYVKQDDHCLNGLCAMTAKYWYGREFKFCKRHALHMMKTLGWTDVKWKTADGETVTL